MADRSLPALHIRPSQGWLNDPNGLCRIDGRYHVFFQYNPVAPVHDAVHWGHVSSTDLTHWLEHPIALTPRPGLIDAAGCWSGCIVDDNGVPTAVYTANRDGARNAVVALARSDRSLMQWQQVESPVKGSRERRGWTRSEIHSSSSTRAVGTPCKEPDGRRDPQGCCFTAATT